MNRLINYFNHEEEILEINEKFTKFNEMHRNFLYNASSIINTIIVSLICMGLTKFARILLMGHYKKYAQFEGGDTEQ